MFEVATQALYREMTKNQGNPHAVAGAVLLGARTKKRLTRVEVESAVGVSHTALQSYEEGSRMPKADVLVRLTAFYGITPNEVLGIQAPAVEEVPQTRQPDIPPDRLAVAAAALYLIRKTADAALHLVEAPATAPPASETPDGGRTFRPLDPPAVDQTNQEKHVG